MPDSTINGLTALAAASVVPGTDVAPVWQASASTTKKVTIADLITAGNTFGTIAASSPATISQTWNNAAVTFTGKLISITDTASNAASLLQDWQVGGVKKASITKGGAFYSWNTYTDASNYERAVFDWTTTANTLTIGTQKAGTGSLRGTQFLHGGTVWMDIGVTTVGVITLGSYGLTSPNNITASGLNANYDVKASRSVLIGSGAALGTSGQNILAIQNGTAPTTSPTNVGQIYVEAGALKYRGAGGTITVLAPT